MRIVISKTMTMVIMMAVVINSRVVSVRAAVSEETIVSDLILSEEEENNPSIILSDESSLVKNDNRDTTKDLTDELYSDETDEYESENMNPKLLFYSSNKSVESTASILMNMEISALDGKTYKISDFSEDYIAIFFGRSGCFNTRGMCQAAAEIRNSGVSVKIILMDIDEEDDGLGEYAQSIGALASLNDPYNNTVFWNILRNEKLAENLVSLPGSFVLDKGRNLIYSHVSYDANGLKNALTGLSNIWVEGVRVSSYGLELLPEHKAKLTAEIIPSDATNKKVKWSSSDTSIATVDSEGNVTAVSAGSAIITVKTDDGGKTATCPIKVTRLDCCWCAVEGKRYWYEKGVKQGTYSDPQGVLGDGTVRGREIYDPVSEGWYWLDSVYGGAKAVGKEVWMPYIYQDEDKWSNADKQKIAYESDEGMGEQVYEAIISKKGKWVRYDENGRMLKGWVTISGELARIYPKQKGNTYYYDNRTGLMAKGLTVIDGRTYYFDEITGVLK